MKRTASDGTSFTRNAEHDPEHHGCHQYRNQDSIMTDIILNISAIALAYWYGRYRRDRRARDIFFGQIAVIDRRTCPVCGITLPGSPLDIQAHGLQHTVEHEH